MNSLNRQIKVMRRTYPTIFPTRAHALDHLFCVIGNGYEWKNGKLVYISRDNHWSGYISNFIYSILPAPKETGLPKDYFYPISEGFSYIVNYPKNIDPHWLSGIVETAYLIIKLDPNNKESKIVSKMSKGSIREFKKTIAISLKNRGKSKAEIKAHLYAMFNGLDKDTIHVVDYSETNRKNQEIIEKFFGLHTEYHENYVS